MAVSYHIRERIPTVWTENIGGKERDDEPEWFRHELQLIRKLGYGGVF